jgi:hypothetical protein
MDGWIGHLHNRYRIFGAPGTSAGAVARLDRLVRERLPEVWAESLHAAFDDDPTVYVIRKVETRVGVNLSAAPTDRALALTWGTRLTRSVLRTIEEGEETGNLVRFADQAEYVARFAGDLVDDRAWACWYYLRFAHLRPLGKVGALESLLSEYRSILAPILARLHGLGRLDAVLAALPGEALRALRADFSPGTPGDSSALRPLFAAALQLADRLGLWLAAAPDREALSLLYLASSPAPADWRDTRSLASAVLAGLHFLASRGLARVAQLEPARLDAALAPLDWLDHAWLRDALPRLAPAAPSAQLDFPVRPSRTSRGPTPRQRAILADLAAALAGTELSFGRGHAESSADVLRLHAALLAHSPRWLDDPAAASLVEVLVAARDALARSHAPTVAIQSLAQGDVESALRTLGPADRDGASGPLRRVADMGEAATALIPALSGRAAHRNGPFESFETHCAGIFLLLRAVLDARLPALVRRSEFPRLEPDRRLSSVLLALGARWGGVDASSEEAIDPGLALFAGLEAGTEHGLDLVRDDGDILKWGTRPGICDASTCAGFQGLVLRTLQGRRLVDGSALRLRLVPFADNLALVGGDASGRVWPLGRIVAGIEEAAPVVEEWLDLWAEAAGAAVESVVCEPDLATALAQYSGVADGRVIENAEAAPHDALAAAFRTMAPGRVGVPDADLTLDLAASALLRIWAAWLKKLGGSSVAFLLENAIRRPGRVVRRGDEIEVRLNPAPLDVVLEMSGYLAELEVVPWLGRRVTFRIGLA